MTLTIIIVVLLAVGLAWIYDSQLSASAQMDRYNKECLADALLAQRDAQQEPLKIGELPRCSAKLGQPTLAERVKQLDYHLLSVDERVSALEKRQTAFEISWDSQLGRDLRMKIVAEVAATPSPATESPTRGCPSDAADMGSITHPTAASWPLGQTTISAGDAEPTFIYVDLPDAST